MMKLPLPLLVLLSSLAQEPRTEIGGGLPPPVLAHVARDLLEPGALPRLIEELRQFRSVAAAFSGDPRDTELLSRERLDRGVLAMRAAAAGKVLECRIHLLEIVAACEHPHTQPYVLDALAALRTLGEPEAYFMDLLARAPSSYHRAAGAMLVLGWTPSDELAEAANAATRACLGVGEKGRPYSAMQRNLVQVQMANEMRRTVNRMIEQGDWTAADKHLLQAFCGLCLVKPRDGATVGLEGYPHYARSNCARILLWQRAAEDAAGLRASLEAMTLYDFLLTDDDGFNHLDPDERLATFREQVLSKLPESVREAKPATRSSGD